MGERQINPAAGRQGAIAMPWFLLLRWASVACQVILIVAVRVLLGIEAPLAIVGVVIGFAGLSNLLFHYLQASRRGVPEGLLAPVMFLDVILLTVLLYYSGGPMNPFTFLYLVHVVLGAVLMQPARAWALSLFTVLCYASFFFLPGWEGHAGHDGHDLAAQTVESGLIAPSAGATCETDLEAHLEGMWLAFSVTVCCIVFFVGRIQGDLARHQQTIVRLQEERGRTEKLAALATLAGGAAHELSTPLATIAVAAGEMIHVLGATGAATELQEDAQLIRSQVERCKEILFQMSADAGEHLGENRRNVWLDDLLAAVLADFSEERRRRVICRNEAGELRLSLPLRTLTRSLRGLVKNGLDAAEPDGSVLLTCRRQVDALLFEVTDRGAGMDRETLAKACEPFFTTKEPGRGMGLGLYLAKTLAEGLGGGLELRSTQGGGTTASFRLALDGQTLAAGGEQGEGK